MAKRLVVLLYSAAYSSITLPESYDDLRTYWDTKASDALRSIYQIDNPSNRLAGKDRARVLAKYFGSDPGITAQSLVNDPDRESNRTAFDRSYSATRETLSNLPLGSMVSNHFSGPDGHFAVIGKRHVLDDGVAEKFAKSPSAAATFLSHFLPTPSSSASHGAKSFARRRKRRAS